MANELFQKMAQNIIDGDSDVAVELAKQAIAQGINRLEAISNGFVIGVNKVGEAFSLGDVFLPELVMAGDAMKSALVTLEPELKKLGSAREILGRVVDQPMDKIIGKALEVNADIIGMSALLTTTMVRQREVIEELDKEGLRPRIKVMIGGAPITREWFEKIKADGYSEDAVGAVKIAKEMVGKADQ
jgi:methanogenic corrinoid protein MtbC1